MVKISLCKWYLDSRAIKYAKKSGFGFCRFFLSKILDPYLTTASVHQRPFRLCIQCVSEIKFAFGKTATKSTHFTLQQEGKKNSQL